MGLIEALKSLDEWKAGGPTVEVEAATASGNQQDPKKRSERQVVAQNEAALAELMKKMPGLI